MTAPAVDVPRPPRPDPALVLDAQVSRPSTRYWDVRSACWRACDPAVPAPRSAS